MAVVAVIGLGYVGLPLATALGERCEVIGFDVDEEKINSLRLGIDYTGEVYAVNSDDLAFRCDWTFNPEDLVARNIDVFIITVPTPVDKLNKPDLSCVESAIAIVAPIFTTNSIVVFESTVYPGATRDKFVPLLAQLSGIPPETIRFGYSPERINPGDKNHTLRNVTKVISGSDPTVEVVLEELYGYVCDETFIATSVEVAEAAKVIENTQRDVNIALVNEFSVIFDRLGIKSSEVLEAARTKWNFLDFRPGLVGGHCIGVDPYYLADLALRVSVSPNVILAGRARNEGMVEFVVGKATAYLSALETAPSDRKICLFGVSFKENVADFRNSKNLELLQFLEGREECGKVFCCDPYFEDTPCESFYIANQLPLNKISDFRGAFDLVILSVPHQEFIENLAQIIETAKSRCGVFDLKNMSGEHLGFSL